MLKRLAFVSVLSMFITLLLSQSVFARCSAWWEIFGSSSEEYVFTGKFEIDQNNPPSANFTAERWFNCRTLANGIYKHSASGYGQCQFEVCSGKTNVLEVDTSNRFDKTRTIKGDIKDRGKCFRYKLSNSAELTYLGQC